MKGIDVLYVPVKRKFVKGHFKGQKRPYICFYTLSLPFRGTDRPSNNAKDAYALAMKTLQRLKKKDPKLLEHFLKALKLMV